jgi:hypothetical protein
LVEYNLRQVHTVVNHSVEKSARLGFGISATERAASHRVPEAPETTGVLWS